MTEETRRVLREALAEDLLRPPGERWQEMIDAGFIDKNGKVLLPSRSPRTGRFPEPEPEVDELVQPEPEP